MKKINISVSFRERFNVMIKQLIFLSLLSFSGSLFALQDADQADNIIESEFEHTHFISDELFIFIHSGPGTNYRIIGSVNAGSPVIVSQDGSNTEFTQITDQRGRNGWVKSEFVSEAESIRSQLNTLQQQLSQKEDASAQYAQDLSLVRARLEESNSKRQSLEEQNQRLLSELESVKLQVEELDNEGKKEMFYMGATVAGGGLIFGIILTMLLKGRKRSNSFYEGPSW